MGLLIILKFGPCQCVYHWRNQPGHPPTRGVGFAIWRCVGYGGSHGPRYRRAYRDVRWTLDDILPARPKDSAVIYTEDDHRFIED
jgi:hypothetical protein